MKSRRNGRRTAPSGCGGWCGRSARVRGQKALLLGRVERRQIGPQAGPLGPLHDRVLAAQDMQVLGHPDVDAGGDAGEKVVVLGRLQDGRSARDAGQLRGPRTGAGDLVLQRTHGLAVHGRHLDGEDPARGEEA